MKIEHVGMWVRDIETVAAFYAEYFDARIGEPYENPAKGFRSRFLTIGNGARLELMTRTDVTVSAPSETLGLAHLAVVVGDDAAVDALAARLIRDGHSVIDGPRRTGDGYYECVALDPEGNRVEITAE